MARMLMLRVEPAAVGRRGREDSIALMTRLFSKEDAMVLIRWFLIAGVYSGY